METILRTYYSSSDISESNLTINLFRRSRIDLYNIGKEILNVCNFKEYSLKLIEGLDGAKGSPKYIRNRLNYCGINKKFNCRINSTRTAPYSNDDIHRNQLEFPEHIEHEKVKRDEDS